MDERSQEQTAEAESERLRRASDDVLMRIGRNLLVYQRIETNLKQLAAARRPLTLGPNIEPSLRDQIARHLADMERRTLGQVLASAFMDTGAQKPDEDKNAALPRITLGFSIEFEDDPESHEWLKPLQETLVVARNRLAHGFLDAFDIETIEGCEGTCRQLDEAHEAAVGFLHWLRTCVEQQKDAMTIGFEFLRSDQFQASLSFLLSMGPLLHALHAASQRLARPDGWCVFDRAAQAIRAEEADLVAEVLTRDGFRTLRHAAMATNAFVWHEEATRNGTRWLFRRESTE